MEAHIHLGAAKHLPGMNAAQELDKRNRPRCPWANPSHVLPVILTTSGLLRTVRRNLHCNARRNSSMVDARIGTPPPLSLPFSHVSRTDADVCLGLRKEGPGDLESRIPAGCCLGLQDILNFLRSL